jgi:hypothetical protein
MRICGSRSDSSPPGSSFRSARSVETDAKPDRGRSVRSRTVSGVFVAAGAGLGVVFLFWFLCLVE